MTTFEQAVSMLTNTKMPYEDKEKFIKENELSELDPIDIANYVTIERNFYKRRTERLNYQLQLKLKK
jgi:hypothetical protein